MCRCQGNVHAGITISEDRYLRNRGMYAFRKCLVLQEELCIIPETEKACSGVHLQYRVQGVNFSIKRWVTGQSLVHSCTCTTHLSLGLITDFLFTTSKICAQTSIALLCFSLLSVYTFQQTAFCALQTNIVKCEKSVSCCVRLSLDATESV